MANKHTVWQGGASKTSQVNTGTIAGTWATSETITTTLDDENGGEESVVTTVTGGSPSVENVRDQHLADLQAETTKTLFTRITWTSSGTDKIVATAHSNWSGVPFVIAGSETSTSGTFSYASTTANSGPNDLGTAANWSNGVPVDDDDADILPHPTEVDALGFPLSYSMLYGLNMSSVDLEALRVAQAFRGTVGDPVNQFYWMIDCDDNGGGSGTTVLRSSGHATWIKGTHTSIAVRKVVAGEDACRLDVTATNVRVLGQGIAGKVKFKDGSAITNYYQQGCPGAHVLIGTGSGITLVEADSGALETDQAVTTYNMASLLRAIHKTGALTNLTMRGGYMLYNSSGNIGTTGSDGLSGWSGTIDFRQNKSQSDVNVYNVVIHEANLIDEGGLANILYPDDIVKHGGGTVASESGQTITIS